jgi:hypothetical protein
MSTYHRKSRFANPNVCPCHGSAPHVYVKKSAAATTDRPRARLQDGKRGPRKGSSGHARPQQGGRPSYPARGQRSGQGSRR